mmetsp:Transcript_80997/g.99218  ORF Transcript_80997/g.99218 Transcript_80997/m.99218 type:complete len:210 (+) Transcript_80997:55-684(+)
MFRHNHPQKLWESLSCKPSCLDRSRSAAMKVHPGVEVDESPLHWWEILAQCTLPVMADALQIAEIVFHLLQARGIAGSHAWRAGAFALKLVHQRERKCLHGHRNQHCKARRANWLHLWHLHIRLWNSIDSILLHDLETFHGSIKVFLGQHGAQLLMQSLANSTLHGPVGGFLPCSNGLGQNLIHGLPVKRAVVVEDGSLLDKAGTNTHG